MDVDDDGHITMIGTDEVGNGEGSEDDLEEGSGGGHGEGGNE